MKNIKQIEEYIRQECIKANPSIYDKYEYNPCTFENCVCWNEEEHLIRNAEPKVVVELSDILLAIGYKQGRVKLNMNGTFEILNSIYNEVILGKYNLSVPFLQQADETKLIIAKLLNYNK